MAAFGYFNRGETILSLKNKIEREEKFTVEFFIPKTMSLMLYRVTLYNNTDGLDEVRFKGYICEGQNDSASINFLFSQIIHYNPESNEIRLGV